MEQLDESVKEYCERLRCHVQSVERFSGSAMLSLQAINAFERIVNARSMSKIDLEYILRAAKDRHLGPVYIGTDLLANLFPIYEDVGSAWRDLAKSKLSHERWVAITALHSEKIPSAFAEELIEEAINDKSAKVRLFAIERVFTRKFRSLVPELKKRARIEKNSAVLKSLHWVLNMLDRGYFYHEEESSVDILSTEVDVLVENIPVSKRYTQYLPPAAIEEEDN